MADLTDDRPAPGREPGESPVWAAVLLLALAALIVASVHVNRDQPTKASPGWVTLLGVVATLGIYTILYRENPIFRFLEHIFIGLATGFGVVFIWVQWLEPKWLAPMLPKSLLHQTMLHKAGGGQWWLIFALLLGSLFYSVYFPRLAWMNRFAFGVLMGLYAGMGFQMFLGLIGPQLVSAFHAPVTKYSPGWAKGMDNIQVGTGLWLHPFTLISLIVFLCVAAYFFFSVEHRRRWIRQPAVAGRYLLMIALGAIFGTTVMGRFSLLIARVEFVQSAIMDWWHQLVK